MTEESVYNKLIEKFNEGEDPIEYNESAMPNKLIFIGWLTGKGFLIENKANTILNLINEGEINEFFELILYIIEDLETPLEVVYHYISTFISSIDVYAKRFEREFE